MASIDADSADVTVLPASAFPRPRWMTDLYVEHHEELEFLWDQRRDALASHEYNLGELKELEGRIDTHVRALLIPRRDILPILQPFLDEDDACMVFAAAFPLLKLRDGTLSERILARFESASSEQRRGLMQALCYAPIDHIRSRLETIMRGTNPLLALAAATVLVTHDPATFRPDLVSVHARNDDPAVRTEAWRLAQLGTGISEATYELGLNDHDRTTSATALVAAAWGACRSLLSFCRNTTQTVSPEKWEEIHMLARIGELSDLRRVMAFAEGSGLGVLRYELLGAYGHPDGVASILDGMESDDPECAEAAGHAFARITGVNVESGERAEFMTVKDGEVDEFDMELPDEFMVPDVSRARETWTRLQPQFAGGMRWCRGYDVSGSIPASILSQLDLKSRRDLCLRSAHMGHVLQSAIDLERYPSP